MKIKCPKCMKAYTLQKEKLPFGKKVAVFCSTCKERIIIDLRVQAESIKSMDLSGTDKKEQPADVQETKSFNRKRPGGMSLKYGILRSMADLPAMPHVVGKTQQIISNPDSRLKDLVSIIEVEQSISARVLRLANSSYYGLSGKVSSVQQASVVLGYKALGEVLAVVGISNLIGNTLDGYNLEPGDLWRHSMAVAVGSRLIACKRRPELKNDAFFAGLMHDAGKLVLDSHVYERKEDFGLFMQDGQETFLNAEREILGFDHSEIASEFCQKWNIPDEQSLAIKYHHYPSQSEGSDLAYILHMADFIAMISGIGTGVDCELYQLEGGTMEFLGLQEKDIDSIQDEIVESVENMMSEMD